MAELNEGFQKKSSSRIVRSRRHNAKVDLTAMVDLAFLLITFFMLTTSLAKSGSVDLTLPENGASMLVDENRTLTIVIRDNNTVSCFMGKENETTPAEFTLRTNELRREIIARKKQVNEYAASIVKPNNGIIVLIKPGKKSNYGNLVDVLDEMAICKIPAYAVID